MNILELHNFLKDKLIDFLPIVDFRYAVNTGIMSSKTAIQNKELGREKWDRLSKIIKDPTSRFVYPYRTVLFRFTGTVPASAVFTLNYTDALKLASEEVVHRKHDCTKYTSKRFPRQNKYGTMLSVSKHFASPSETVLKNPVALVGKDALDEMKTLVGIFDAPFAENLIDRLKGSSSQLSFIREVHPSNNQSMNLTDVILPPLPSSYTAKDPTEGYAENLFNEITSGIVKYNEIFETENYGIKELSRAGFSAISKLNELIQLNFSSVEEAEAEERMYTMAPFYTHTDWSGIEKFPTDRDLRQAILGMPFSSYHNDGKELLKFKDTLLPIRSRAMGNFNMRCYTFELNLVLNRAFSKEAEEGTRSMYRSGRHLAVFPTPDADRTRFSLPTMYSFKASLYLYALQLANIYYTVRMPELREEIKKLDIDTKNAINRVLYVALLEICSNLISSHKYFITLLSYVYLKYKDTSDEFTVLLDQFAKLYAVLYSARARLMKYTLALTASGNALASVSVGNSETLDNVITESYRIFAIGVLHSESNLESEAYNLGAIWDKCITTAIATRNNKGGGEG